MVRLALLRLCSIPVILAGILGLMWAAMPAAGAGLIIVAEGVSDLVRYLAFGGGVAIVIATIGWVIVQYQDHQAAQIRAAIWDRMAQEAWALEQVRRFQRDAMIIEGQYSTVREGLSCFTEIVPSGPDSASGWDYSSWDGALPRVPPPPQQQRR